MMQSRKLIEKIYLGVFFVAISQIGLAINPIDWFWGWLCSIFILSIGECILFPSMNIYLDRIAPNEMKGLYFGVATLYSIGFVVAPFFGGVILDLFNGPTLFTLTFLICLLVGYLYLRLQRKCELYKVIK
jgi:MFS family permease